MEFYYLMDEEGRTFCDVERGLMVLFKDIDEAEEFADVQDLDYEEVKELNQELIEDGDQFVIHTKNNEDRWQSHVLIMHLSGMDGLSSDLEKFLKEGVAISNV